MTDIAGLAQARPLISFVILTLSTCRALCVGGLDARGILLLPGGTHCTFCALHVCARFVLIRLPVHT